MESSVLRVGKISDEIFIYMYGKDKESIKKKKVKEKGTSLVVQWLGICLPMQRTQVRSLVPEDFTGCAGQLNDSACTCSAASHRNEKPAHGT